MLPSFCDKPHLPSNLAICTRQTKSLVAKPGAAKVTLQSKNVMDSFEQVDDALTTSDAHYLSHYTVRKINEYSYHENSYAVIA